jgi:hypothetical protein
VGGVGRLDIRAGPRIVQADGPLGPGRQQKAAGRRNSEQGLVCHKFGLEAAQLGVPDLNPRRENFYFKKKAFFQQCCGTGTLKT